MVNGLCIIKSLILLTSFVVKVFLLFYEMQPARYTLIDIPNKCYRDRAAHVVENLKHN
jgi:hypothetical protein